MTDPNPEQRPPSQLSERRGLSPVELGMLALAGAVALGGLVFWWVGRPPPPATVQAAEAAPAPPADAGPTPAPAPSAASDATRALLDAVSPHRAFRAWLDKGDVLNRWALVTDNLAEGVSPRKALEPLAPAKPFAVAQRGERTVIAPEAYRRYDAVADAVASVDPAALAAAYHALHPVLEAAWRTLGDPHGSLDAVAARALGRLAAAPLPAAEVEVVAAGPALYVFADPALEALGPVEKHLQRMGPRNARLVRDQAAALRRALKLPPPPAGR